MCSERFDEKKLTEIKKKQKFCKIFFQNMYSERKYAPPGGCGSCEHRVRAGDHENLQQHFGALLRYCEDINCKFAEALRKIPLERLVAEEREL